MKHLMNTKTEKLTRRGFAFLLALVLTTSAFVPGLTARATEEPTEPTLMPTVETNPTVPATTENNNETVEVCPGDDTCAIEGCPNHTPVCPGDDTCTIEGCTNHTLVCPGDATCTIEGCPNHVTGCETCGQDVCVCEPAQDGEQTVEPTPYEKAISALTVLEEEAKTLTDGLNQEDDDYFNQVVDICDAYYDRLFAALNVVADMWESDSISDDEYMAAEETVAGILKYLLDTYGYEYGISVPLVKGDYKKYFISDSNSGAIRQAEVRAINMPKKHPDRPVYVDQEIPEEYVDVILGYKEATELNIHIPKEVKVKNSVGTDKHSDGLSRCKNAIVNAISDNYSKICGKAYVEYLNVGEKDDGTKIHVRVTIVDYEPLADKSEVYIGLQTTATNSDYWGDEVTEWQKRPGVSVYHVNWVKLQYDFFDDNGNAIAVKGNTTYYDVDWNQTVHLHDAYSGIYVTNDCLLDYFDQQMDPEGTPKVGAGCVMFDDYNDDSMTGNKRQGTNAHAEPNDTKSAFSETFNGSTMTRTFSFRRGNSAYNGGPVTAKGAIFHSAEPVVRTGKLIVSKTVKGIPVNEDEVFTFDIELGKKLNGTYGEITFANGKATVQLRDGETVTASKLPAGITYAVTEREAQGYVTSSVGATGTIPLASLGEYAEAKFFNATKTDVTVKKLVTGNFGDLSKDFTFQIEYTELLDGTATNVYDSSNPKTVTLRHGEETVITDVLTGTELKISEVNLRQDDYDVSVNGQKVEIVDGAATFTIDPVSRESIEIVFTNKKDIAIDTGISLDSVPYVVILCGVVAAAVFLFLRKRPAEE